MERTIRKITDNLVSLLPEEDQYYNLEELRDLGFPRFIVNRVRVELEKNLAESMRPPQTDWANTASERVQSVWQEFINAIRAEARLPASYAHTVVETAVADALEMLIQPRKNIPEVIFGTDKELPLKQVEQRMSAIVVYRHFATLIPRYMQKKELDTLTKERCKKVISSADDKMTARYSPLNWAQMLEPLFSLMNEQIDTNLLRLFFEDKKMPRVARQFDLMNSAVNRATLIEVLSSPDSLNFEGYGEDQSELFEGGPVQVEHQEQPLEIKPEDADRQDADEDPETEVENETDEDPILSNFHFTREKKAEKASEADFEKEASKPDAKKKEEEVEDEQQEQGEPTLNTIFGGEAEVENDSEDTQDEDMGSGLNSTFNNENEEELAGDEPENILEEEQPLEEEQDDRADPEPEPDKDDDTKAEIPDSEKEETPMWQRYMSPQDIEAMEAEEAKQHLASLQNVEVEDESAEDIDEPEDAFIDDPIIDLTGDDEASKEEVSTLRQFLKDDRKLFITNIFRDSERAYEEAIEEIAAKEDWKSASKFIENDVFKRNLIDMYSEAAVDFTDRLQSYFIEKSKS